MFSTRVRYARNPNQWSDETRLGASIGGGASLVYLAAFMQHFLPIGPQWIEYVLNPTVFVSFILVSAVLSMLLPQLPQGLEYPETRSEILSVGKTAGLCPIIGILGWYLLNAVFWSAAIPFSVLDIHQPPAQVAIRTVGTVMVFIAILLATLHLVFVPLVFGLFLSLLCVYLPVIAIYRVRVFVIDRRPLDYR